MTRAFPFLKPSRAFDPDSDTYDATKGPRNHARKALGVWRPNDTYRDVEHGPVIEIDPSTIDPATLT